MLPDICVHSSERERASVECEREVDEMKEAEYMEHHIGEEYHGMVSSITNFGMFVILDNLIEGLVPITELGEYYVYDEKTESLVAQHSKKHYRIGDELVISVLRASKKERKIDFKVVKRI